MRIYFFPFLEVVGIAFLSRKGNSLEVHLTKKYGFAAKICNGGQSVLPDHLVTSLQI